MFKNILAPITPSTYCEFAADAAIAFAQRYGSKLVLLHVHGIERPWDHAEFRTTTQELEKIKSNISAHYRKKLEGVPDHTIAVDQGIPHTEILRYSREMDADLIVMCPYRKDVDEHQKQAWGRVGSTMERVSQQARCPIMIVTRETPLGGYVFNSILVATDFSLRARFLVDYAGQMAARYGANLTVFNVLDIDATARNMTQEEIAFEIEQRKQKMVADYGESLKAVENCTCYECWEGQPSVEILKLARRSNASVVLMAHHSKETDPDKALLGSTLAKVATSSLCPIICLNHHFELRKSAK